MEFKGCGHLPHSQTVQLKKNVEKMLLDTHVVVLKTNPGSSDRSQVHSLKVLEKEDSGFYFKTGQDHNCWCIAYALIDFFK